MAIQAIAAIAAPIIGGLIGNLASQKDSAKQRSLLKQALAEFDRLGAAPDLSRELILREFQQVGILTPELEQEMNIAESEVAKIKEDQSNIDKQKQALEMVSQVARGGARAEDKAATRQMLNEVNRNKQSADQSFLNRLAATNPGAVASAGLMQQLASGQQAAELASQQGLQISADASRRALDAMQRQGSLAGDIRSQGFQADVTRQQAVDDRNRFRDQNSIGRETRNVATKNVAKERDLSRLETVSDKNTDLYNTEEKRQLEAEGTRWDRELNRANAKSGKFKDVADAYSSAAKDTKEMYGNIGKGAGKIIGGL